MIALFVCSCYLGSGEIHYNSEWVSLIKIPENYPQYRLVCPSDQILLLFAWLVRVTLGNQQIRCNTVRNTNKKSYIYHLTRNK